MTTKCWTCQNACGKCSWSKKLIPVKGWTAMPTKIAVNAVRGIYTDSYLVLDCPKYIADERSN